MLILKHLYGLTGAPPGLHDVLFLRIVVGAIIVGGLYWLSRLWLRSRASRKINTGEKIEQINTNSTSNIGRMSLILAIGGVVLPIFVVLLLAIVEWLTDFDPPYMLCLLLFVALEIAALVTGIIGRRSACGKAGLTISAILLVLTAIGAPFLMISSLESTGVRRTERTETVLPDERASDK